MQALRRDLLNRTDLRVSGTVDQHPDRPVLGLDRLDGTYPRRLVGDIKLQRLVHSLLTPQPMQYFTETVDSVDPAALGVPPAM